MKWTYGSRIYIKKMCEMTRQVKINKANALDMVGEKTEIVDLVSLLQITPI